MKYRIRDCILSDILGKDYYLPVDRNYVVDIENGWHVHLEDAQAGKLIAVVEDEKGNIVFEKEFHVRNGRLIIDIYYGDYVIEGTLTGIGLGSIVGILIALTSKRIEYGILPPIASSILGSAIGKMIKGWKVRKYTK